MPLDSADTVRLHLLPAALTDKLATWCGGAAATVAGGFATFGWVSLLTWSADDPSLSQATNGPVSNALGIWGATGADALLQLFGSASVIVLLFAMHWSVELAVTKRIERWPVRLCFAPLAVLAVAGAVSAFPKLAAWSFHHGYGGVAGDVVISICSSVLAFTSPIGAQIVSGVLLAVAGITALACSLGGRPAESIEEFRHRFAPPSLAGAWGRSPLNWQDQTARTEPVLPDGSRNTSPFSAGEQAVPETPTQFDPLFDAETEHASLIAQRFAPERPRDGFFLRRKARRSESAVEPERPSPAAREWRSPSLALLQRGAAPVAPPSASEMRAKTAVLEAALADFGIQCTVRSAIAGPIVTSYELSPASAGKCERIIGLAGDITQALGSGVARAALLSDKQVVVLEVPNAQPTAVRLRDVLETDSKREGRMNLPLCFGLSATGQAYSVDLSRVGHVLLAGAPGSHAAAVLDALTLSLMHRLSPDECRLAFIESSRGRFGGYDGMPHLAAPIVRGARQALSLLEHALDEIPERRKTMAQLGAHTIRHYNELVAKVTDRGQSKGPAVQIGFDPNTDEAVFESRQLAPVQMPRIVILVEDLAALLLENREAVGTAVTRLLQDGGDLGLHMIAASPYPEDRMALAQLERSFPCRAALRAPSRLASRLILGEDGASQLTHDRDMLVLRGGATPARVHGGLTTSEDIAATVRFMCEQGPPDYVLRTSV